MNICPLFMYFNVTLREQRQISWFSLFWWRWFSTKERIEENHSHKMRIIWSIKPLMKWLLYFTVSFLHNSSKVVYVTWYGGGGPRLSGPSWPSLPRSREMSSLLGVFKQFPILGNTGVKHQNVFTFNIFYKILTFSFIPVILDQNKNRFTHSQSLLT